MAAHLQRVAELEAPPHAFLRLAGAADGYERASERTDAARARATRERWERSRANEAIARAAAARQAAAPRRTDRTGSE